MFIDNSRPENCQCAGATDASTVDRLTILHSVHQRHAAKRFFCNPKTGKVTVRSYDRESHFRVESVAIDDFRGLCRALDRLAASPFAFMIRGEPLPGINPKHTRRLLHPDKKTGDAATFAAAPRRWLAVDIDHVAAPAATDPASDPEGGIEHLIGLLPGELADASCWWQWTSSQGTPGHEDTLSARLWFWTSSPLADPELRRWAAAANAGGKVVDPSLYSGVQPHYVAAPAFDGLPDPLPRRSGVRIGLDDEVSLVIPPPAPRNPEMVSEQGYEPGLGVQAYLAGIGGGRGFREPIKSAVASYIATYGSRADCEPLKAAIRAAIAGADPGGRSPEQLARYAGDEQLDALIGWIRDHHGDQPPKGFQAEPPPEFDAQEPPAADPPPNGANEDGGEADAEIARLAKLGPLAYEREREAAAKRLDCRPAILDRLVAAARGADAGANGQGRALLFYEPEPWPEPIDDGAALLDAIAKAVREHVVLRPLEADAVALWTLGVHAFAAWRLFPRLALLAVEKGCGKTTLLDVVARLAPKPLKASHTTAAALFRVIEKARPCVLLDEADAYLTREAEELRAVVDAGHQIDGAVIRTVGDNHDPRLFSCWSPLALAAIGKLPGTVADRSIIIHLVRRLPGETIQSLRADRNGVLDELARKMARWAADNLDRLGAADPLLPPALYNRAADNWRPLLALADLAGGDWPHTRAPAAAAALVQDDGSDSRRIMLLADIRALFAERAAEHASDADRISSDALVTHLTGLESRPWAEFRHGRPLTKVPLAALLKPLKITPGTVRLANGGTIKGYYAKAFSDAFARYLPP